MCMVKGRRRSRAERGGPGAGEARDGRAKGQAGRWEDQEGVVSWRPVVMTMSAGPET